MLHVRSISSDQGSKIPGAGWMKVNFSSGCKRNTCIRHAKTFVPFSQSPLNYHELHTETKRLKLDMYLDVQVVENSKTPM